MKKWTLLILCGLLWLTQTPHAWADAETTQETVDFFCALHEAPADAVQSLLCDNSHLLTYDLTVYAGLTDNVRTQVDGEIAQWSLMTDVSTLAETEAYFAASMDEVLSRAQIAENAMESDAWLSAIAAVDGADLRFINDIDPGEVRMLYGASAVSGSIAAEEIARALDEAQLLAVARTCHWSLLREAYFYYTNKGVIPLRPEVQALRNQEEFFRELAVTAYKATSLSMFITLAEDVLERLQESNNNLPVSGGGGAGGNSYSGGSNDLSCDLQAEFETPLTGVAIAAVYSGRKLLSFHWQTMNHTSSLVWNILYSSEQMPTHAKIMTFANDGTFCPLTEAKTCTLSE